MNPHEMKSMCLSPASPVGSEISVGSPSPPPMSPKSPAPRNENRDEYFRPLKRLKMSGIGESNDINYSDSRTKNLSKPPVVEGVKSFNIADILGRDTEKNSTNCDISQQTKIVRPWDHFHLQHPISVRPFIPPALLHYEQRLAMDYHQQLQEHFRAQAQLLRHMNLEIIPSESGSERSSSVASDCCSPDIGRTSDHSQKKAANNNPSSSKTKSPNETPLDALFTLTNKNFDETQDDGG